jgi:hypothetical protein
MQYFGCFVHISMAHHILLIYIDIASFVVPLRKWNAVPFLFLRERNRIVGGNM